MPCNLRVSPRYEANILELGTVVCRAVHSQVDFATDFWHHLELLKNARQVQENLDGGCCLGNAGSLACRDERNKSELVTTKTQQVSYTGAHNNNLNLVPLLIRCRRFPALPEQGILILVRLEGMGTNILGRRCSGFDCI